MAAKPLSKTKIVSHIAEKLRHSEEASAFSLRVAQVGGERSKGGAGKFVIPGIGRIVKAHRKARMGRNPQLGKRSRSRPRRGTPASSEGVEGCDPEVVFFVKIRGPAPILPASGAFSFLRLIRAPKKKRAASGGGPDRVVTSVQLCVTAKAFLRTRYVLDLRLFESFLTAASVSPFRSKSSGFRR